MKKLILLSLLSLSLVSCDTDRKAVEDTKEKKEQATEVDNQLEIKNTQ